MPFVRFYSTLLELVRYSDNLITKLFLKITFILYSLIINVWKQQTELTYSVCHVKKSIFRELYNVTETLNLWNFFVSKVFNYIAILFA